MLLSGTDWGIIISSQRPVVCLQIGRINNNLWSRKVGGKATHLEEACLGFARLPLPPPPWEILRNSSWREEILNLYYRTVGSKKASPCMNLLSKRIRWLTLDFLKYSKLKCDGAAVENSKWCPSTHPWLFCTRCWVTWKFYNNDESFELLSFCHMDLKKCIKGILFFLKKAQYVLEESGRSSFGFFWNSFQKFH